MVVAGWRIVMQSLLLLEIFFFHILDSSQYELLYTFLEVLDFGKPLPRHTSFTNNSLSSFFSDSHCEYFPGCELVQTTAATRPEQLLSTAGRSVIAEIIFRGFVFNLLYALVGGQIVVPQISQKIKKKTIPTFTTRCGLETKCQFLMMM